MELTRRQLLKLTGLGLGGVLYTACTYDLSETRVESPTHIPEDLVAGLDTWYATLCRECGASEGIIVRVMEGRAKKIQGNPLYPTNTGKHRPGCEGALQALYHPDRLAGPLRRMVKGVGQSFEPTTWSLALEELSSQLAKHQSDPRSVVIITDPLRGSAADLMQRFATSYGARHVVFEPAEQTVLYETTKRLYGSEQLPHFDIANASSVLSFGADFLSTWLNPVGYMRQYGQFRQGTGRKRGRLVHVEPRFSMTAANADEWVPVNPGMEGVLALSMAYVIVSERKGDQSAADALTGGAGADALRAFRPGDVASVTGVPAEKIERIAKEFADHQPGVVIGGGSAGAHTNGLFNLSAIYSLNLLMGNTNKRGGVWLNPQAPLPELRAQATATPLGQWQPLIDDMKAGRVQMLIVRGADPLYGIPKALGFEAALSKVPMVVSFSSFMNDTAVYADLIVPEHTGLEDWGNDVPQPGPGFQTVGYQQPVVREYHERERLQADRGSRGFADVMLALAEGLPKVQQALPWKTSREMLMDSARKLQGLGKGSVVAASFDRFWIDLLANGGWWDTSATSTATPPKPSALPTQRRDPQFQGAGAEFHLMPFASNAMGDGRGAHIPWLQAAPDPVTTAVWGTWIEINLGVAKEMGIKEGETLRIISPAGEIEAHAFPHPAIPRNVVAIPMGQGHRQYGRYAQERGANVLSILAPAADADTGALAWAATKVRVEKTGRRIHLPKFEGTVELPTQLEEGAIIKTTKPV
ncbi:MAG: 4Fe-4S ferredoxin [Dehalococcoidia bacterium]|nr:4Fe-4S ferredoxin [Dehalococcoidia bacterium]